MLEGPSDVCMCTLAPAAGARVVVLPSRRADLMVDGLYGANEVRPN